jgi:hypothetical protein
MSDTKSPEKPAAEPDVAFVHEVTPEGKVHIIRRRGDRLEAGALEPLREGAPIRGEVVSLKPRADVPRLCDVEVLYTPPATTAAAAPAIAPTTPDMTPARPSKRKGPAQVATDDYRSNWDSIWSRKPPRELN